jgi:hypothetical protein
MRPNTHKRSNSINQAETNRYLCLYPLHFLSFSPFSTIIITDKRIPLGKRDTKPGFASSNSEKRRHSRFSLDLPVEYRRIEKNMSRPSRAIHVNWAESGQEPVEFGLRNEL